LSNLKCKDFYGKHPTNLALGGRSDVQKTEHQLKIFGEDFFLSFDGKLPKWILIFDKADSMLVFLHPTNEVVLIFLVCRAPFYMGRKSRYTMHGLEITMQPRRLSHFFTRKTRFVRQMLLGKMG